MFSAVQQICVCLFVVTLCAGAQDTFQQYFDPRQWKRQTGGVSDDQKKLIRRSYYYMGPRTGGKKRSALSPIADPMQLPYSPGDKPTMKKRAAEFSLSKEDYAMLQTHRQQLLRLLAQNQSRSGSGGGYFAFPRQGRAMSFYFPRMGRSGSDQGTEARLCCSEGVRSVFSPSKGSLDICPREQLCCEGLQEQTKLYQDLVITDCSQDTSLEKIRRMMRED